MMKILESQRGFLIARWSVWLVLIPSLFCRLANGKSNQPNIVIFVADDLGIGDVGCFGNDTILTPNIDRIANEGVKFTHHLAAAALCTPSRAALLTGRYPIRSGMVASHRVRVSLFVSSTGGLPPEETTFAEVAQNHGYSTALIGKWHLGVHCSIEKDFCHHPRKQGFDYFYGVPLTNLKDFGDGTEGLVRKNVRQWRPILASIILGGVGLCIFLLKFGILPKLVVIVLLTLFVLIPSTVYVVSTNLKLLNSVVMRDFDVVEQPIRLDSFAPRLVNEGVQFIEKNNAEEKPFLLMMSWLQVHVVLHASKKFQQHSKHGPYGDNVEEMDWSVGEILNTLERLGILNNTFVYFTSDNGGHLEGKGVHGNQEGGWNGIYRGSKGQGSMEGGIRVPTVAMWRGHIPSGSVVDLPTSQMDLYPTLLESVMSASVPTDRVIDGQNIYSLLQGTNSTPPHRFLVHYCGTDLQAARFVHPNGKDVFKLYYATPIWEPGSQECGDSRICDCRRSTRHNPPLLYNIGRDPSELNQLSVDEHIEIVASINQAVEEHRKSVPDNIPSQFAPLKMLPNPFLQPCCNFPYCDCVDPVYS